jgi:hypothetical protein
MPEVGTPTPLDAPPEPFVVGQQSVNGSAGGQTVELTKTPPQPEGAIVPDEPRTEAERLDPQPQGPVTLSSGTRIEIQPLKLRETMKLLRIITHGAGGYVGSLLDGISMEDPAAFAQTLVTVLLMSIPDAERETVEFIQTMCVPAELPADKKAREQALSDLADELDNPELEDMVTIIEVVIRRESEDIRALGKRLGSALNLAARVGQAPKSEQTTT